MVVQVDIDGTTTVVLIIAVLEIAWVWYQVNVRGPQRSKAIVREVLAEKATASLIAESLRAAFDENLVSKLKKDLAQSDAANNRWAKAAETRARADEARLKISTWLTANYGPAGPLIMKGADAFGLTSDKTLAGLGAGDGFVSLIKPFADSWMKKNAKVETSPNPYMEP